MAIEILGGLLQLSSMNWLSKIRYEENTNTFAFKMIINGARMDFKYPTRETAEEDWQRLFDIMAAMP